MLTLHSADRLPALPSGVCPMSRLVGHNFVTRLRSANTAFPEHEGPLSVKCAFHGEEMYRVDDARFLVDDSSYLVLNRGQRYRSSIQSESPVDSFCVWFGTGFAERVLAALRTPADRLLDDPTVSSRQPVLFFERLRPHDDLVSPVLFRIRAALLEGWIHSAWLEEQQHLLLERLLQAHRGETLEIERLPAARWSTRVELYRRLHRAKDFLDSSLTTGASLAEAASVASLSPHHFLRLFKSMFHETPGQYQGRRRMEKARDLLARTDRSVTDICFGMGFESLGSFSWLFRRRFGASPSQYRLLQAGAGPLLTKDSRIGEAEPAEAH